MFQRDRRKHPTNTCFPACHSFLLKFCAPQSSIAKLLPPIIPIGIVAKVTSLTEKIWVFLDVKPSDAFLYLVAVVRVRVRYVDFLYFISLVSVTSSCTDRRRRTKNLNGDHCISSLENTRNSHKIFSTLCWFHDRPI